MPGGVVEVGEQRARVDLAPLEVRRQARRAGEVGRGRAGRRTTLRPSARNAPSARAPPPPRTAAGRWAEVGLVRDAVGGERAGPSLRQAGQRSGSGAGAAPAVGEPGPEERRVDAVRRAVALAHAPGCDGVRRARCVTSVRPASSSAAATAASRRAPYGAKSAATCTVARPLPRRRPRAPRRAGRRAAPPAGRRGMRRGPASERTRQARRTAPAGSQSARVEHEQRAPPCRRRPRARRRAPRAAPGCRAGAGHDGTTGRSARRRG